MHDDLPGDDGRELLKMLKALAPGDVVVTRIDRLARSTFDLFARAPSA
jgi:DNA invertase Pin-like site-specific DNA recombinase